MSRRKISELRKALKTHGFRLEEGDPHKPGATHGTLHWKFINPMGDVLFTVNQDDLFDRDGNRFFNDSI